MPDICDEDFLQFFENAVKNAVKEGLETQFKIVVQNSICSTVKFDFSNEDGLHSAYLILSAKNLEVANISLEIFATSKFLKACLDNAFGTNFDLKDEIVIEGVGEFINIISGIVRKNVNDKYNLNFDLTCPVISNYIDTNVLKEKILAMKFFKFETNLGDFLFGVDLNNMSLKK